MADQDVAILCDACQTQATRCKGRDEHNVRRSCLKCLTCKTVLFWLDDEGNATPVATHQDPPKPAANAARHTKDTAQSGGRQAHQQHWPYHPARPNVNPSAGPAHPSPGPAAGKTSAAADAHTTKRATKRKAEEMEVDSESQPQQQAQQSQQQPTNTEQDGTWTAQRGPAAAPIGPDLHLQNRQLHAENKALTAKYEELQRHTRKVEMELQRAREEAAYFEAEAKKRARLMEHLKEQTTQANYRAEQCSQAAQTAAETIELQASEIRVLKSRLRDAQSWKQYHQQSQQQQQRQQQQDAPGAGQGHGTGQQNSWYQQQQWYQQWRQQYQRPQQHGPQQQQQYDASHGSSGAGAHSRPSQPEPRTSADGAGSNAAGSEEFPVMQEPPVLDASTSIKVLRAFLKQAGAQQEMGLCHEKHELLALAQRKLNAWEIRRVLQCSHLGKPGSYTAVFRGCDGGSVMRVFKELRLKVHPDKNHADSALATQAFQFLQEAYDALT